MSSNNFSIPIPSLTSENYCSWAIKMESYLRALSLWDVIENDVNPTLPQNPTIAQIKKHGEDMAKRAQC